MTPSSKQLQDEQSEYGRFLGVWREYVQHCALKHALDHFATREARLPCKDTSAIMRAVMELRSHIALFLGNKCFSEINQVHRAQKKTPRECLRDFVHSKPDGKFEVEWRQLPVSNECVTTTFVADVHVSWRGFAARVDGVTGVTNNTAMRNAVRAMCEQLNVPCN